MPNTITWMLANPTKSIAIILATVSLTTGVAFWIFRAENSHAQAAEAKRDIAQIVEAIDGLTKEHEIEAATTKARNEEKRKMYEYVLALCRTGKMKDKMECAKVGVTVE